MNDAVVTLVELICSLRDRLTAALAEVESLKKAAAEKEAEHGV